MGYAWSSRGRLCPPRMVSDYGYSYPRFYMHQKYYAKRARTYPWPRVSNKHRTEFEFERKRWEYAIGVQDFPRNKVRAKFRVSKRGERRYVWGKRM